MPAFIITLIGYISVDLIKKLLVGAGLGFAAAAFFKVLLNIFIDKMIVTLGGLGGSLLGLLGLFGFDKALSIIIGALAMRAAINAMQISLKKA